MLGYALVILSGLVLVGHSSLDGVSLTVNLLALAAGIGAIVVGSRRQRRQRRGQVTLEEDRELRRQFTRSGSEPGKSPPRG